MKIGQTQLIKMLFENKGRMISIVSKTNPALLRKSKDGSIPNPFKKEEVFTVCHQTVNPMCNYENAVNRQLDRCDKEPAFESGERKNGSQGVNGWPLAVHNGTGNIYLRVTNPQVVKAEYQDENANVIDAEVLASFIPEKKNKKQEEAGLEKKFQIKYRDITLDNIVQVTIGGQTFDVEGSRITPWPNPWPTEQLINA